MLSVVFIRIQSIKFSLAYIFAVVSIASSYIHSPRFGSQLLLPTKSEICWLWTTTQTEHGVHYWSSSVWFQSPAKKKSMVPITFLTKTTKVVGEKLGSRPTFLIFKPDRFCHFYPVVFIFWIFCQKSLQKRWLFFDRTVFYEMFCCCLYCCIRLIFSL